MSSEPESFDPYDGCDVLRSVVEHALSPYLGLPREDLEDLRDFLIVHVTTHPAMEPLYARLKGRKVPGKSGVSTGTGEDALSQAAGDAARAARGGRS